MSRSTLKLALLSAIAFGMATGAMAAEKLKVGFVYVGPVGDFGYSYQHDQGRQAMQKALGDAVETTFLENVPEADSERSIEQLARSGHKLIFTTSFGFMEPTLKVAKKFPKINFEHATGYKRAANVATYSARFHEGRYVIGQIAGRRPELTTTGGTSDARFIKDYCPVVEFGLVGQTMHKVDENTPVDDVRKLADIYKGILDGFFPN